MGVSEIETHHDEGDHGGTVHDQEHRAHHGAEHGGHGHAHANDQGLAAVLRYIRLAPQMWRSDINDAVIKLVNPQPGERVVDIGAGMGASTVQAARLGADIVAVEPTPFIRGILSVRRLFQRRRNQITVTAGAAEALPVDTHSVDAIWAVNTMHHWIDIKRATTEIGRALRSGGRIVLIDENFEDPRHPDYERWTANRSDDHAHHGFSMIDTAHIAALLVEVGLDDVVAFERLLADRPVLAVTARAPVT